VRISNCLLDVKTMCSITPHIEKNIEQQRKAYLSSLRVEIKAQERVIESIQKQLNDPYLVLTEHQKRWAKIRMEKAQRSRLIRKAALKEFKSLVGTSYFLVFR